LDLGAVKPRQVVEAHGHVGMLEAQGLFPGSQRSLGKFPDVIMMES
jgi:hypothetical protein